MTISHYAITIDVVIQQHPDIVAVAWGTLRGLLLVNSLLASSLFSPKIR
jgi:hypothetical protein